MRRSIFGMVVVSIISIATSAPAIPVARLHLEGDPEEWVSGGAVHDVVYDDSDGGVVNSQLFNRNGETEPYAINLLLWGPRFPIFFTNPFQMSLLAQVDGVTLQVGTYEIIRPSPTPLIHSISMGFQGRGSGTLVGRFTISELSYLPARMLCAIWSSTSTSMPTERPSFED